MIAKRLFLNHSPSEWFSFIQKECPPFYTEGTPFISMDWIILPALHR